jgi:protein-arginine kinase activator protein McsA
VSAESRAAFSAHGARAVCRLCLPERAAYADGALARALDDAGFAAYRRAVVEASTAAVYQEEDARLQRTVAALRAELAAGGAAARHRLRIAEEVLCLRCPRCGQAFVDFSGCFALTCGRCAAGFCGYCLEDCGADAHAHVARCPHNSAPGRDVFGSTDIFARAQADRRARALAAYLAAHVRDPAERAAVLESVAGDLADLGIPTPPP